MLHSCFFGCFISNLVTILLIFLGPALWLLPQLTNIRNLTVYFFDLAQACATQKRPKVHKSGRSKFRKSCFFTGFPLQPNDSTLYTEVCWVNVPLISYSDLRNNPNILWNKVLFCQKSQQVKCHNTDEPQYLKHCQCSENDSEHQRWTWALFRSW